MLAAWRRPKQAHREYNERFFLFDEGRLQALAAEHKERYAGAEPFPHTVIEGFLPADVAENILEAFPAPDSPIWLDWKKRDTHNQPKKQGIGHIDQLRGADPYLFNVLFAFNSYPFLKFLETLTGIEHLLPDPTYNGGGLHQILPGGKLHVHADFNYLPTIQLYRRINVLVYFNKHWKEEYGSALELWDKDLTRCVESVAPLFNRCVIFNTTSASYHGHPTPLACPEGMTRKSLAFYYYTREGWEGMGEHHSTLWKEV